VFSRGGDDGDFFVENLGDFFSGETEKEGGLGVRSFRFSAWRLRGHSTCRDDDLSKSFSDDVSGNGMFIMSGTEGIMMAGIGVCDYISLDCIFGTFRIL